MLSRIRILPNTFLLLLNMKRKSLFHCPALYIPVCNSKSQTYILKRLYVFVIHVKLTPLSFQCKCKLYPGKRSSFALTSSNAIPAAGSHAYTQMKWNESYTFEKKTNRMHAAKYYLLINELYRERNVMYIKFAETAKAFISIKIVSN